MADYTEVQKQYKNLKEECDQAYNDKLADLNKAEHKNQYLIDTQTFLDSNQKNILGLLSWLEYAADEIFNSSGNQRTSTLGMDKSIEVVKKYIEFLKIQGIEGKIIQESLEAIIKDASSALKTLKSEIKSATIYDDKMDRFKSALKGVGLALAAVVCSVLALPIFIFFMSAPNAGEVFCAAGALFSKSFNEFKKVCAPGDAPFGLETLSENLTECIAKLENFKKEQFSNKQYQFFSQPQGDSHISSTPSPKGPK